MKIAIAALSVAAVLLSEQAASAQSIYNATRPAVQPGQPGWALIGTSMNNFHPSIGNSAIAVNANAALIPLVQPSMPMLRPQYSTYRTMPSISAPSMPPAIQPLDPMRAR